MAEETILSRLRNSIAPRNQPLERAASDPIGEAKVRDAVNHSSRSRVSATLRQLRAARGLSYETIREQTGLSQQLLYDVEYGDRRLQYEELRLLAECYGVSPDDVLGVDIEAQWRIQRDEF